MRLTMSSVDDSTPPGVSSWMTHNAASCSSATPMPRSMYRTREGFTLLSTRSTTTTGPSSWPPAGTGQAASSTSPRSSRR